METRSRRLLMGFLAAIVAALLIAPAAAFAAGPGSGGGRGGGVGGGRGNGGGGGPGGGGGGGGGEETTANNLSVPAIFVGASNPFGLTCDGTAVDPTGTPLTGYSIDPTAYYFVQGIHTWRAACNYAAANTVSVAAGWGDNLTGDAALKVGSPIRVEMGLDAGALNMPGYTVDKLEPSELDRVSPYGTKADSSGTPLAKVLAFGETRVWDPDAHLKIYPAGTPTSPVFDGPATAEINATGRVVYGYNLRVATAGTYVIEFTAPNVAITSADAGTISADQHMVTLEITVGGGGGGGGGHGRP